MDLGIRSYHIKPIVSQASCTSTATVPASQSSAVRSAAARIRPSILAHPSMASPSSLDSSSTRIDPLRSGSSIVTSSRRRYSLPVTAPGDPPPSDANPSQRQLTVHVVPLPVLCLLLLRGPPTSSAPDSGLR
uniref:Uncharacterized protein n=1 Tax=Arundo donax TaxID=35708 RepID=A0A0A9NKU8_ARUDO